MFERPYPAWANTHNRSIEKWQTLGNAHSLALTLQLRKFAKGTINRGRFLHRWMPPKESPLVSRTGDTTAEDLGLHTIELHSRNTSATRGPSFLRIYRSILSTEFFPQRQPPPNPKCICVAIGSLHVVRKRAQLCLGHQLACRCADPPRLAVRNLPQPRLHRPTWCLCLHLSLFAGRKFRSVSQIHRVRRFPSWSSDGRSWRDDTSSWG